ncbi:MAG TPA: Npun_F5560 family protein [Candidatus Caenarcaniphilales bacterium]
MSQANHSVTDDNQAESLHQELQLRDQVVQQLSTELLRLLKGNPGLKHPSARDDMQTLHFLRRQLKALEKQLTCHQEQAARREAELTQLRHSVQELSDRNHQLEQVVQKLPVVYRQKFTERVAPIKQKMVMLHQQNLQLRSRLQSVSYRLAVRTRQSTQVASPEFAQSRGESILDTREMMSRFRNA